MTALPKTTACICSINDEWLTISFNQPEKRNALTEELTTDIKNILRVSDNTEEDMKALATVYETKFKILEKNLDDVDTNLVNLRETWQEMKPTHPDVMTEHWDDEEEQLELFCKEDENYYMGESGC